MAAAAPVLGDIQLQPVDEALLAVGDTLHDASDGFRNINDPSSKERIMEYLTRFMIHRYQCPQGDMEAILRNCVSQQSNITVSDIEDRAKLYLEKKYDLDYLPSVYSYQELLDPSQSDKRDQFMSEDSNMVVLSTSGNAVKSFNKADKERLSKFILKYMFPGYDPNSSEQPPIQFTFDAKKGVLKKIFADNKNTCNLLMPANLCDSAPTSFKVFGKLENVYAFVPSGQQPNQFISDRNYFSKEKGYQLIYEDKGYGDNQIYAFDYGIHKQGVPSAVRRLSSAEPSGPTLDYLLQLFLYVNNINDYQTIKAAIKCLHIGKSFSPEFAKELRTDQNELEAPILLDLKRCGDEDQVDSAKAAMPVFGGLVVLSTIDRLCALAARLKGVPCIYNQGDNLILYRVPTEKNLSPEDAEKLRYRNKKKSLRTFKKSLLLVLANENIQKLIRYRDTILPELISSFQKIQPTMHVTKMITEYVRVLQIIYQYRYLTHLIQTMQELTQMDEVTQMASIPDELIAPSNLTLKDEPSPTEEIKVPIDSYSMQMEQIMNYLGNKSISMTTLLNTPKIKQTTFSIKTMHPFIKYDSNLFFDLTSSNLALYNAINGAQTGRGRSRGTTTNAKINFVELLNHKEKGYNVLMEEIISNFMIVPVEGQATQDLIQTELKNNFLFVVSQEEIEAIQTSADYTIENQIIFDRFNQFSQKIQSWMPNLEMMIKEIQPSVQQGGRRLRRHKGGVPPEGGITEEDRIYEQDEAEHEIEEMRDALHTISNELSVMLTSEWVTEFPNTHAYVQINKLLKLKQTFPEHYPHVQLQMNYVEKILLDPRCEALMRLYKQQLTPQEFHREAYSLCDQEVAFVFKNKKEFRMNDLNRMNRPEYVDWFDRSLYLWEAATSHLFNKNNIQLANVFRYQFHNGFIANNLIYVALLNDYIEGRIDSDPSRSFLSFVFKIYYRVYRESYSPILLTVLERLNVQAMPLIQPSSVPVDTGDVKVDEAAAARNNEQRQQILGILAEQNQERRGTGFLTRKKLPVRPPTVKTNGTRRRNVKASPSIQINKRQVQQNRIKEGRMEEQEFRRRLAAVQRPVSAFGGRRKWRTKKAKAKKKTKKRTHE